TISPSALCRSLFYSSALPSTLPSFPTRRSSDLPIRSGMHPSATHRSGKETFLSVGSIAVRFKGEGSRDGLDAIKALDGVSRGIRSEEHTSELQSLTNLVCRLLLEKKKRERNDVN